MSMDFQQSSLLFFQLSDLHRQSVQQAIQEVSDESDHQPVVQCPFQPKFNIAPEYHTQLARYVEPEL